MQDLALLPPDKTRASSPQASMRHNRMEHLYHHVGSRLNLGLVLTLCSCLALSQQLPDPSHELQRQEERNRALQRQLEHTSAVRLETPTVASSDYDARCPMMKHPAFLSRPFSFDMNNISTGSKEI